MSDLSAADRSQIYTELTEATSQKTAEVIMATIVEAPWDSLVTKDYLDASLAQIDVRFAQVDTRLAEANVTLERALRSQTIWLLSALFAVVGLLAAWVTAFG